MKREYTAPEADIEKFIVEANVFCYVSGNEPGDNPYDDDDF